MNLVFNPALPVWTLVVVATVAMALAIAGLWRNWKSGVFRCIALLSLLMLLANPMLRQAEKTGLNDIALILVDQSQSQTLGDRGTATEKAAARLEQDLDDLDNVETRRINFSGEEETQILSELNSALADTPRVRLGSVFVISDGQAHDISETVAGLNAPVHLLRTGDETEIDRKITLTNAPRYGIVDQPVRITFKIEDLGPEGVARNDATSTIVTLKVDGELVLQQPVPLGAEAGFDAPLNRPGATIIELAVEAREGELTTRNNIAVLPISAIRDRLRVLLISGEPHPGERVWRNLLKSDPAVDLVHFTILRPIEKNDNSADISELALITFPQDELFIEKLTEFDLLIFDRYTYRAVLDSFHFDNIARYVEGGGAVLIAAGPEFNGQRSIARRRNLSFILPALPAGRSVDETYRPIVTDIGARHPVTANLPEETFWGRWLRLIPVDQLRGQALMSGPDDRPLLILDRYEEGRVGLLLSDHVWLWARGFDGGGPHAELLRRIAHWLMKEPELEEEALSLTSDAGALVIKRRTISEDPGPVSIEMPNGDTVEIDVVEETPGQFTARIEEAPRGLYRARAGQLFAIGAVGLAAAPEFIDVVATRTPLEPLISETQGGVFLTGNDGKTPGLRRVNENASRSGENWAGIVKRNAARVEAIRDEPVAPALAWLILIGLALLMAWAIEGGRLSANPRRP